MKTTVKSFTLLSVFAICMSCTQQGAIEPQAAGNSSFTLTSTAFTGNGEIPKAYTCTGENISPSLHWSSPPAGTKSFAIIMDDPDARPVVGYTWTHWIAYNIQPTLRGIREGIPKNEFIPTGESGAMIQGITSFKSPGYGGPCPPEGTGVHHYHFTLYALSIPPELPNGLTKKTLLASIRGKIIGEAKLTGTFEKK